MNQPNPDLILQHALLQRACALLYCVTMTWVTAMAMFIDGCLLLLTWGYYETPHCTIRANQITERYEEPWKLHQ